MASSQFLLAFQGKNTRVPVWFMRQAGRFLPEYQEIKKHYSLDEMFKQPDIASKVTLLPVELLKVDAAILFADILTLPSAMGFDIQFVDGHGPVIKNPILTQSDIQKIHHLDNLFSLEKTIQKINAALPADIPLIGFAGSPYSVLAYLIGNKSRLNPSSEIIKFIYCDPHAFHKLMNIFTRNTIQYLKLQKKAGIKAFQIFDTWAGQLRRKDYKEFVMPYVQQIFKGVDLPSIYYLKNSAHLFDLLERLGADVLSVCETVTIGENPLVNRTKKGIQGNLFNGILKGSPAFINNEVMTLLTAAKKHHKKYIFNLNHGILPGTDVDKAKYVIHLVKNFKWKN